MIVKNYSLNNISKMIISINNVILLYVQGNSANAISKKLNISTGDVYKILVDNEIKLRKGNSNNGLKVTRVKNNSKKIQRKVETPSLFDLEEFEEESNE